MNKAPGSIENTLHHSKSSSILSGILSEILQYNFRLPLTDFAQLIDYVNSNIDVLQKKSDENNMPSIAFEYQLIADHDRIPISTNIFDTNDITFISKPSRKEFHCKYIVGLDSLKPVNIASYFARHLFSQSSKILFKNVTNSHTHKFNKKYIEIVGDARQYEKVAIGLLNKDHRFSDRRKLREPLFDMVNSTLLTNSETTNKNIKQTIHSYEVEIIDIQLNVTTSRKGPIEPFYGYFALYDYIESKKKVIKITENMRVDINPIETRKSSQWIKDDQVGINKCIINLDISKYSSHDIRGVLMLYKNAESDSSSRELYFSDKKNPKPRELKKFERGQLYQQFLCAGVTSINIDSEGVVSPIHICNFYSCNIEKDDDLVAIFQSSLKVKQINGSWKINMFKTKYDDHDSIVDWNDHPIHGNDINPKSLRVLQTLDSVIDHYSHNLYIYPTKIIFIKIYLRDTQTPPGKNDLSAFYPVVPSQPFESVAISSVSYTKYDIYLDEIKMKLPTDITNDHNLLFVIEDVFNNDSKDNETRYGYIPLIESGHLRRDTTETIILHKGPVPESYMISNKPTEQKQYVLHVRLNFISSLYLQNDYVHSLFRSVDPTYFISFADVYSHFNESLKQDFVENEYKPNFTDSGSNSKYIFTCLTSALTFYICEASLSTIEKHINFFFQIIIKSLVYWMKKHDLFNMKDRFETIRIKKPEYGFFKEALQKLSKHLALEMRKCISLKKYKPLSTMNLTYANFIKKLLRFSSRTSAMDSMETYVITLSSSTDQNSDIVYLSDKETKYESDESWRIAQMLKIDFIRNIQTFEYFIEINNPTTSQFTTATKFLDSIFNKHFLAEFCIYHLTNSMIRDDAVCKYALMTIIEQIVHLDTCFSLTEEQRNSIAEMYFSYINYMCIEHQQIISKWHTRRFRSPAKEDIKLKDDADSEEKSCTSVSEGNTTTFEGNQSEIPKVVKGEYLQVVYLIFFWTLKNISHKTLTDIIRKTNHTYANQFLSILELGLEVVRTLPEMNDCIALNFKKMAQSSRSEIYDGNIGLSHIEYDYKPLEDLKSNGNLMIVDNINLVVLEVVDIAFRTYFTREDSTIMDILTRILGISLFKTAMTNTYFPMFLAYIRYIIRDNTEFLFQTNPKFAFDIVNGIITQFTSNNSALRQEAMATFYLKWTTKYKNDKAIRNAIKSLEKWAKDDFSVKRPTSSGSSSTTNAQTRQEKDLGEWELDVINGRLKLIDKIMLEHEKIGKRKAILRSIEIMKTTWTDIGVISQKLEKLSNEIIPLVAEEDHTIAILTTEIVDVDVLNNALKKVEEETTSLIDLIKDVTSTKTRFDISVKKLSDILVLIQEITQTRLNSLQMEKSTKHSNQEKMTQFITLQTEHQNRVTQRYKTICEEANNTTNLYDATKVSIESYKGLQHEIKTYHEQIKEEDKKCTGTGSWESVFSQWEIILPKTVTVLRELIDIQNILDGCVKDEIIQKEVIFGELAASEQLVKVCMWCVNVEEIIKFPLSLVELLNEKINYANELLKQHVSIEKMIQFLKAEYAENEHNKSHIHEILYKEFIEQDDWRSKLSKKLHKMQSIHQTEVSGVERKESYIKDLKKLLQYIQLEKKNRRKKLDYGLVELVTSGNRETIKNVMNKCPSYVEILRGFGNKGSSEKKGSSTRDHFFGELKAIVSQVNNILQELQVLNEMVNSKDGNDVIMEKYLSIADGSLESPNLHLTWYSNIHDKQYENKNYVEAGIASVHIAYFIYCAVIKPLGFVLNEEYLKEITDDFLQYKSASVDISSSFLNKKRFTEAVNDAIAMFEKAHQRKLAIALCNFVIPYFHSI
ncbi:Dedicator of cytokinesis protein [Entamoeba marina]